MSVVYNIITQHFVGLSRYVRYLSIPWTMCSVVLWSMSNVVKWFRAVSESAPASDVVCFDSGHWSKHCSQDISSLDDVRLRTLVLFNILVFILPYTLKFCVIRLFKDCSVIVWRTRTINVKNVQQALWDKAAAAVQPLEQEAMHKIPSRTHKWRQIYALSSWKQLANGIPR